MDPITPSQVGDYTWEVARWFPKQGHWSEAEYLELTESSNKMVELTDGTLEFLAMPTIEHQLIVGLLFRLLSDFAEEGRLGMVLVAPHPTFLRKGKYREPDLVFKLAENVPPTDVQYFEGADLIIEIVSDDNESHKRDYETKAADYAEAKIPEYWIVDPQQHRITVLTLEGDRYREHRVDTTGEVDSKLLPGFRVDVESVFATGKRR